MLFRFKVLMIMMVLPVALLANIASAECVLTQDADAWDSAGQHAIVLFDGSTPLATVEVPSCPVTDNSQIYVPNDKLCDGGFVIIDGQACKVTTVKPM